MLPVGPMMVPMPDDMASTSFSVRGTRKAKGEYVPGPDFLPALENGT